INKFKAMLSNGIGIIFAILLFILFIRYTRDKDNLFGALTNSKQLFIWNKDEIKNF
ncbi:ExsB family protein, partial [human gut metagenome]